jgi:hypothetical protein
MADEEKKPTSETPQRPAGAPDPPENADEQKAPAAPQAKDGDKQPSEVERKADELMTPDPYPNDPDGGPGKGPSYSSPVAMVGWFCLGFFFGLIGLLITMFLVWRRDRAVRSRAITYSCLGVILEVVLGTIAMSVLGLDPNTVANMQMGASSSSSSVW